MEQRNHRSHPFNPSHAIPFLAWMNSSQKDGQQGLSCLASVGTCQHPSRVLLQELLWQFKLRECPALEDKGQRCSHGTVGYHQPLTWDSMLALIPLSECRLLERLCARIPPSHTAAVLFRFREILAHNYVVPWELACIFKQVLRDFLKKQEDIGYRRSFHPAPTMLLPFSPPPTDMITCDEKITKSSLEGQEKYREEIPTISSYVDRHLHSVCSYTLHRDCLPYYRSFHYD